MNEIMILIENLFFKKLLIFNIDVILYDDIR